MAENRGQDRITFGVEVSSSALNGVYLDEGGTIARTYRKEFDPAANTVEQIVALVAEVKGDLDRLDCLGIAVPGLVHGATRKVAYSASMPAHTEVDLAHDVAQATGLKTSLENDANAAAYGEFRLGAGRNSRDLFYATLGAGVGGAFIFGGSIWRGKAGFAGEFGYVSINAEGMRLEDVASSANIVRRTQNRMRQDNTSSLSGLDEKRLKLSDILSAAQTEDDLAQMMLERTGEYVGTAVASVINLLNIETIVLGGELMEAGHYVLESVIGRAKELSFAPSFAGTRILSGTLGRNASAAGAALLACSDRGEIGAEY